MRPNLNLTDTSEQEVDSYYGDMRVIVVCANNSARDTLRTVIHRKRVEKEATWVERRVRYLLHSIDPRFGVLGYQNPESFIEDIETLCLYSLPEKLRDKFRNRHIDGLIRRANNLLLK